MKTLRIKTKIIIISLLLVLLLVTAVTATWVGFTYVEENLDTTRLFDKQRGVLSETLNNISNTMQQQGTASSRTRVRIGISIFNQGLDELVKRDILNGRVDRNLKPIWREFESMVIDFLALDIITADNDKSYKHYNKLQDNAERLNRTIAILAIDTHEAAENIGKNSRWTTFAIVGLALLSTLFLLINLFRTIAIPLGQLTGILLRVEDKGDFSIRADFSGDDETGRALGAFNRMMESLQLTISSIGDVMARLAKEDFSKPLKLDLKGDLNQIEKTINSTALALQRNIEAREIAEQEIRLLSKAVEQAQVSTIITDPHGKIEYVNPTFERVTGFSQEEVKGKTPGLLDSVTLLPNLNRKLRRAIESGKNWTGEILNHKKDGEPFWEKVHITPVHDEEGVIMNFLTMNVDISVQKLQEEKILNQAHYDSLTGLPNRFLALDRLTEMIKVAKREERKVVVMFLDLDDFKKINDTMGHQTGDQLLVAAANRLKSVVREMDTVGRLGGDEFIILLDGINDDSDGAQVAENIVGAFQKHFIIADRELVLTSSVGIACYPRDGEEASLLLRHADTAMYHSKEEGRNTFRFFTGSMNQSVAHRLLLEDQLRAALANDELFLVYQPIMALDGLYIVGAEALLRWHNKELGNIPPDEFINIAEQTGLILPIGYFVLEQAMAQVAIWRKNNKEVKMAVNASPRQFRDINFAARIREVLAQFGLPGDALELEITEGVLMTGQSLVGEALTEIKSFGISIAMDDFGTGYSSLSYLRSYPFNTVKIDRSFVADILIDPADRELVIAAQRMTHGLGMEVVAEGVENKAQLELLRGIGCDMGQGWLFGKPLPAREFEELYLKSAPSFQTPYSDDAGALNEGKNDLAQDKTGQTSL